MESFSGQEGGYPDFSPQEVSENPHSEKNLKKYLYVLIGVVVLAIILFALFAGGPPEAEYGNGECEIEENCLEHPIDCKCKSNEICSQEKKRCIRQTNTSSDSNNKGNLSGAKASYGNGICDSGENCLDHPRDCICSSGQYCSKEKKCVSPFCGNGICESKKEGADSCCEDCPCPYPECQSCNPQNHKCEMPEFSLSEGSVRSAVMGYYEEKGLAVGSITVKGDTCRSSKIQKQVEVEIIGSDFPEELLISGEGEVSLFRSL